MMAYKKYIAAFVACLAMMAYGDLGDEPYVISHQDLTYRHLLRVEAKAEKSVRIINPIRWQPLEFMISDGTLVKAGEKIAQFNRKFLAQDEKSLSIELGILETELAQRLTHIDNQDLEMNEQLEALQDKLASQTAKLERLLSEPKSDDLTIAEEKLKVASLNMRLANNELTRARNRFAKGMLSQAEVDSVEKAYEETKIKFEYARRNLELINAPLALPYDIEQTKLEVDNCKLEIEKLQKELQEQSTLSDIQKNGASQRKIRHQRRLDDKRQDLLNLLIKAPIDGYISHVKDLTYGMKLGHNQPFMEIPDLKTMGFNGMLLEAVRKHFDIGDTVYVHVQGELEKVIECKLTTISTLSHDLSERGDERENKDKRFGVKVFDIVISVSDASANGILPGMTGLAEIVSSKKVSGPCVPLKYVRHEEGKSYIIIGGTYHEVTGTSCDGWFVLDDESLLGKTVLMRGTRSSSTKHSSEEDERRLVVTGELDPVRKVEVKVKDTGWWPWPKVTMLVPEETIVKKGDVIAQLDPKDRELQIAQQESQIAEIRSQLEASEKTMEITKRNGEYKEKMAKNTLAIARSKARAILEDKRMPLSYYLALQNRDLAIISLKDAQRKLDREKNKKIQTLSPVEMKKLERDLKRKQLKAEQAQINLDIASERKTVLEISKAKMDLIEAEAAYAKVFKSVTYDNVSAKREYERIKSNLARNERRLAVRQTQLQNHTITAPSDGLICYNKIWDDGTFRKVTVGSLVGPRYSIMSIPDLSEMEVKVELSEQYFPLLHVGMEVEVRVPSLSEMRFSGQVSKIDLMFSNKNKKDSQLGLYSSREPLGEVVFNVRIHFRAPELSLKPGLVSEVTFPFMR